MKKLLPRWLIHYASVKSVFYSKSILIALVFTLGGVSSVSADSLRHCNDSLDNTGKPLEFLKYDIDMDLRDPLTPDIGADEFVGGDSSSYSAGLDGELCNGAPIAIGAPITGSTYQWSTGSSDSMIQVSTPGDYTVILSSACGGTFTDVVTVTDITPSASSILNIHSSLVALPILQMALMQLICG